MSKLAASILTKGGAPATVQFVDKPKTLYELLNVQRLNAYKFKAQPVHWHDKGFEGCFYEVHRVKYRQYQGEPTHGKAWGIMYWNGKPMHAAPREIRGGLKFGWRAYASPADSGITYDRERARSVERRRSAMLKAYHHAQGGSPAESV